MNIVDKNVISSVRKYKNIKAQIVALEKELDDCKTTILTAMGDSDTATCKVGGMIVTVTNKAVTSTRIDTKKLKVAYPKVAAECSITTTAARFIVK